MDALPAVLVVAGVALLLAGLIARLPWGWGGIPPEHRARSGGLTVRFPLGASLLLSLVLTVALNAALCGAAR